MTRLLLDVIPEGQLGMDAMLGAPPQVAAALAPGPAALAPLSQQMQQLVGDLTCSHGLPMMVID